MTKRQRFLISLTSVAIMALAFLIIIGDNGLIDLNRLKNQKNKLIEENQKIQEEISLLFIKINRAKNDPSYIESIARQELGMIGKDEVILKFDKDIKKPEQEKQETKNE